MLCTVFISLSLVVYSVFKLKLMYKVNMMIQRSVILLLVMMVVFVGCGEDKPDKLKPKIVDEVADLFLISSFPLEF